MVAPIRSDESRGCVCRSAHAGLCASPRDRLPGGYRELQWSLAGRRLESISLRQLGSCRTAIPEVYRGQPTEERTAHSRCTATPQVPQELAIESATAFARHGDLPETH